MKKKLSLTFAILLSLPDFSSGETDFHFCQFLSNFFKYSSLNFPLSHLYNIFVVYFHSNSSLLKFLSSTLFNFSYLLILAFNLSSNSTTAFFVFSKFSSFFQLLCSTINLFYHTKYFTTSLIFLLFNIFFTFHSSTFFTFTGFTSSTFCPPTYSLYYTT